MPENELPLWISGWAVATVLGLLALMVMMAAALLDRSGPIRLRHWAEKAGGGLRELYDAPPRFEAFRLLLSSVARWMPALWLASLWSLLVALEVRHSVWFALLGVGVLVLIAEGINRWLVERHAEEALRRFTRILGFTYGVAQRLGLVWLLSGRVAYAEDHEEEDDDEDEASEDEINAFLDVGRREGILEPGEDELVRSIVDFGDTRVRSVMTPRVEIVAAPVETDVEELADLFFTSKHARVPLYHESIDHIIGIVHIRDLFEALHAGEKTAAETLAKPPHYVPDSKPLRILLEEMQSLQQQMAIVVDEYGGVAGLVTMEDLVEEIVGEISDEHETPPGTHMEELEGGVWRLDGRTHVEELMELFDADFNGVPYETVSGLICGRLGYVPSPSEELEIEGLRMVIEDADERRIKSVAVRRVETEKVVES